MSRRPAEPNTAAAREGAEFGAAARRDAAGPRDPDNANVDVAVELAEPVPFALGGFRSEPTTPVNHPIRILAVPPGTWHAGRLRLYGRPPQRDAGGLYAGGHSAVWARTVRQFGRDCVWLIPAAALTLGAAGWIGPPTASGLTVSGWIWFGALLAGLALSLLGAVSLAGLLAAARGRRWALAAVLTLVPGSVLTAAMAGVLAWAGSSAVMAPFDALGATTSAVILGWVALAGALLLAAGWTALGMAVASSRVLNRSDGILLIVAAILAAAGAYSPMRALLMVGALLLLAAGVGLAWTAARLARPQE